MSSKCDRSGRPLLYPEAGVMRSHTIRTTDKQWEKLETLGGAEWLRKQIDAAKVK